MATPATYNFCDTVRGDTIRGRDFTITIDASPANITASKLYFRRQNNDLVFAATTSEAGGVVTMAAVPGSETASWPVETIKYDLEVTLSGGLVRTYVAGTIKILRDESY